MHRLTHKHIDFSKMFHHVPAGCTRNTKRLQLDELDDHALLSCCHNLTWFYSNQREILLTCTAIAHWNNFQQFFSSKHHWTGFHPNPFHCSMDWTIKIEGVREYFLCLALWTLWLARIDATSRSRRWMVRGLTMRWLVFFFNIVISITLQKQPKTVSLCSQTEMVWAAVIGRVVWVHLVEKLLQYMCGHKTNHYSSLRNREGERVKESGSRVNKICFFVHLIKGSTSYLCCIQV